MTSRGRTAGLDLLRGLAIGLVMVRHAAPGWFGGAGIVGVVLFFTLSGYLITGVLGEDLRRRGRVDSRRFYRNRALRLLPALGLLLVVYSAGELLLGDPGQLPGTVLTALTYTADLRLPVQVDPGMTHLWTLSVEEQFYLVWPLLLVVAARRDRLRSTVVASAVLLWLVCAVTAVAMQADVSRLYTLPTSWAVTLAIGAVARLHRDRLLAWGRTPAATAAGVVGLGLLLALSLVPEAKEHAAVYLVGGPLVALVTVVLIAVAERWRDLPWSGLRPLLALGTVSYAAYLWNLLIVTSLERAGAPGAKVVAVPATLAAAAASWWLVERPVARWRRSLDARGPAEPETYPQEPPAATGAAPADRDGVADLAR